MTSRRMTLAIAATLVFAGTAYAQTQAPPKPGVPGGAGQPISPSSASSQRERDTPRSTSGNTRVAAAGNVSAGMPVQTISGEPLGIVRDVVPNAGGEPGYVLITLPSGGKAAVPYSTVSSMTRSGAIVLDRARLEGAPHVQDSQLRNPADTGWQKQADQYWNGRGSMRSVQPGHRQGNSSTPDQG